MVDLVVFGVTDLSVALAAGFSSFSEDALRGTGVEVPFRDEALGRLARSVDGVDEGLSRVSFEENMRVRRSLTEDLSGGFRCESGVAPLTGPFCGVTAGDFLPSCDFTDGGFELDAEGGFEEVEAAGMICGMRPRSRVTAKGENKR